MDNNNSNSREIANRAFPFSKESLRSKAEKFLEQISIEWNFPIREYDDICINSTGVKQRQISRSLKDLSSREYNDIVESMTEILTNLADEARKAAQFSGMIQGDDNKVYRWEIRKSREQLVTRRQETYASECGVVVAKDVNEALDLIRDVLKNPNELPLVNIQPVEKNEKCIVVHRSAEE